MRRADLSRAITRGCCCIARCIVSALRAARSTARDDGLRADRLPHHELGQMRAAGEQAAAGRDQHLQSLLAAELKDAQGSQCAAALGSIGHNAMLRALGLKPRSTNSRMRREYDLPTGQILIDSYHCSRYNTQTRRLTEEMFDEIFARARDCWWHRQWRWPGTRRTARTGRRDLRPARVRCHHSLQYDHVRRSIPSPFSRTSVSAPACTG